MKYLIPFIAVLFYSCSDQNKMNELLEENKILKQELLKSQTTSYKFQAFVVPSERNIILGDTFYAAVGLAAFDINNPISVSLGKTDYENKTIIPTKDIPVNKSSGYAELKIPAEQIGNFSHNGVIYHKIDGKKEEFMFNIYYEVSEK